MKHVLLTSWILIAGASVGFCADKAKPEPRKTTQEEVAPFSGKVSETMNASSYTYVRVDTGKKKLWAAAPRFEVKVGDTVTISEPMAMRNYHSQTLNRDFDVVYFTGRVTVNGQPAGAPAAAGAQMPKDHPPIGGGAAQMPKDHPPVGSGVAAGKPRIDVSGVKKAEGGKTVEEICLGKAKLSGQKVQVRGKVVKYNAMIMGKNWLHIQDGTGSVGNNDLLVTTATDVKLGDTVLVTGNVATNKDFGANYKYAVMIEDAKVVVE